MNEVERRLLRRAVLSVIVDESEEWSDDNFAIAMATYYEDLPKTPTLIQNDECSFSAWAVEMTDALADRIIDAIIAELKKKEAKA